MPGTMIRKLLPVVALMFAALLPLPAVAECHEASFSGMPYSANESAGKITITVGNGGGQGLGSVDYRTKNGTAKSPKDYRSEEGTLVFPPGTTTVSFVIEIENDGTQEPDETFLVELSNPTGCFTTIPEPATVTIEDNDQQIVQPTPTPTPTPTQTKKPKPKPTTASPSPSPSSPSPTTSSSPIAIGDTDDGGLSGGALAGIVGGTVVLGGAAAFWVRRKFLV